MAQKLKQDRSIGDALRKLRKKSGFTQEQVAIRMQLQGFEITRSIYSQMECGTYSIRITELDALAELFGTDYNAFFSSNPC